MIGRRLRAFWADERATSDVEYILLTAMVVLPLFIVPVFVIDANRAVYRRIDAWVNLPFP